MSDGNPPQRPGGADKATLEAAIDRLARLAKDLRMQDLTGLQDRWDPRIEALQKRINTALGDVLGVGTPEYKDLRVGTLDASLDTSFGDRYSSEELRDSIRGSLDKAIRNLNAARELLTQRLQAAAPPAAPAAPRPAAKAAPTPPPKATAAPTPAPTPAPTAAPTAAPTPGPTPAPTPVPTPPTEGAPVSATATLRVAIVNRLDDASGAVVADFITQLGMDPVAVAEPSGGADGSFIDRLEGVRGADYAVVLLPTGELDAATGSAAGLLEIGFLFGVMARRRVCFILPSKPTLPPELAGLVIHHVLDDGELWRLLLAREMRKGGLDVDMNKAV
ncbi:MAG TPA: hypothetical protein VEA40_01055 [Ramlibacter sp.]|nr:hypothetical protein [Ramlibacter sp.]